MLRTLVRQPLQGAGTVTAGAAAAAFPTIDSITESTFASAAGPHSVSLDNADSSGDLLIMIFQCDGATTPAVTTPTGWTQLLTDTITVGASVYPEGTCKVYIKSASGSEGASVSVTVSISTIAVAQVYRIPAASWWGTLATGVFGATGTEGASSTPSGPSLEPGVGSADFLWINGTFSKDDSATVSSYTAGYTNGTATINNQGANAGDAIYTCSAPITFSAMDPGSMTLSEAERTTPFTLAVRPAA